MLKLNQFIYYGLKLSKSSLISVTQVDFLFWSCGEYLRRSDFPSTNVGFKRFLKYVMPRQYDLYCAEKFKAKVMSQLIEEVCRNT